MTSYYLKAEGYSADRAPSVIFAPDGQPYAVIVRSGWSADGTLDGYEHRIDLIPLEKRE